MFDSEWETVFNYIKIYFNQFIAWFQSLELPAQILVGIFLFFGFWVVAYAIYGSLWITIQSIKFSILITFIIVYMTFVTLGLPLVAITGPKNIPQYWTRAGENVKSLVASMYPVKSDHKHVQSVIYTTQAQPTVSQNPPIVILKESKFKNGSMVPNVVQAQTKAPEPQVNYETTESEMEEIPQIIDPNLPVPPKAIESFCPDCGEPFSDRMKYVLLEKTFTFCEQCGLKIYKR